MKKSHTKNKKILAFRFSAMGDVAMTVPVLRAVLQQNPNLEITMVSRPFFEPLFSNIPNLHFIGVDLKKYKGVSGLYRLFKELKKQKPDAIADLHDVLRSKILRLFFKTSFYKIGVIDKGRKAKRALTRSNNKTLKPLKTTHERYADVFRKLGLEADLSNIQPASKPYLSQQVKGVLNTFENKNTLGIAPFAAHEGKQYPLKKTEELIKLFLGKNQQVNIVLLGGGSLEKEKLKELEKIDRNRMVNIAGLFSFDEELQIISRLQVMLSMDSGNGHLAALYGVPVISIWGATHPYAGFAPFGQKQSQQILPDLNKFPQLPTSIYGNKTFESFEQVWESIPVNTILETILPYID